MLRRAPALLATGLALLAAATACSSSDAPSQVAQTGTLPPTLLPAEPGTRPPGSAPGTTRPGPPGSTPATVLAGGTCPDKTELVIHTKAGDKAVSGGTAWADVALNKSAQIVITNFETDPTVAETVWQPKLEGDQVGILFYITSTGGEPLQQAPYVPVGSSPGAPLQLNNVAAYSAAGREILGGFKKSTEGFTLTKIDDTHLCGTFDLAEGSGVFVATRTP